MRRLWIWAVGLLALTGCGGGADLLVEIVTPNAMVSYQGETLVVAGQAYPRSTAGRCVGYPRCTDGTNYRQDRFRITVSSSRAIETRASLELLGVLVLAQKFVRCADGDRTVFLLGIPLGYEEQWPLAAMAFMTTVVAAAFYTSLVEPSDDMFFVFASAFDCR